MADDVNKVDIEKEADLDAEQTAQEIEVAEEQEKLRKALEEVSGESDPPGVDDDIVD